MPVIVTFDIQGAPPVERNRLQSMFERLHWQRLGGSAYRYPILGEVDPGEDWLNHVVPALMLFRAYLLRSGRPLTKFTLDVQTSTGGPTGGFNPEPIRGNIVPLSAPGNVQFGEAQLRLWLEGIGFPY